MQAIIDGLKIFAGAMEIFRQNDRFTEYLLDGKYILRISKSELPEQKKHNRVSTLPFVPKIHMSGTVTVAGQQYHGMLFDYMPGDDLWSVAPGITEKGQYDIGKQIAQFLNELHLITDNYYDIGHYIPTVPRWKKTWKEGHFEYAAILKTGISKEDLKPGSQKTISEAFNYIHANLDSLEYQAGAKLLHNDFHPKNIIIREGRLTAVVDWECSQFGEADFELSRLIDWCVYPDNYLAQTNNLGILFKTVIENLPISAIPDIEKRMTIYQLEHEINQLIWRGKRQEDERIARINEWLNGKACVFK